MMWEGAKGGDDWKGAKGGGKQWEGAKGGGKDYGCKGGKDYGYDKGGGKDYGYKGGGKDYDGGWGKGDGGWGKGDGGWGKGDGGCDYGKGKGGYKDGGKGGDSWGGKGGKDAWGCGKGGGGGALGPGGFGGGDASWGCGKGGGGGAGEWLPEQIAWVKAWHEDRGFGFVTVAGGEDVYVHRTLLMDGDTLVKDCEVWVEARWDHAKNKWSATRCAGAAAKGGGKGMDKGKGGKGKGKGKRGPDWLSGATAWVKTWNEERGFGFVTTDLNEDVYCHRTVFTDGSILTPQAVVTIDAKWLWEKNKWQATTLSGASGEPPKVVGVDNPVAMGEQGGILKAWNAKGFGFIVPDNGGPDVYVHKSALPEGHADLQVGEVLIFDLQIDAKTQKFGAVSCKSTGTIGEVPAGKAGPPHVRSLSTEDSFGPAAVASAVLRQSPYASADTGGLM